MSRIPQDVVDELLVVLSKLYTSDHQTQLSIIQKHISPNIHFTDNIVSINGIQNYTAQMKSLPLLFSKVEHVLIGECIVENDEVLIENKQVYTIGGREIGLEVKTSLKMQKENHGWVVVRHLDEWKGKIALFQVAKVAFGSASSFMIKLLLK